MKSIKILSLGLILIMGMQGLVAQETTAKKYDNPQWYNIVHVDYLPGKYNKARKIISDYHKKASTMAGTPGPVMILEMNSGSYDIMTVWHMKDGIESLNWVTSPDNIKWRKAMNEIAGSSEKADKIIKEYQSYIASSSNSIGRLE